MTMHHHSCACATSCLVQPEVTDELLKHVVQQIFNPDEGVENDVDEETEDLQMQDNKQMILHCMTLVEKCLREVCADWCGQSR